MTTKKPKLKKLAAIVEHLTLKGCADITGVKYQAVQNWLERGLPRTEYSGETSHARMLSEAANGMINPPSAKQLLDESREHRIGK